MIQFYGRSVGRVTCGRALQLHPNQPGLYILAASQEVEQFSPSAARTHLQRGIRLNSESVELWREYVKMELGYIERLRRRWEVLGIEGKGEESGEESEEGRREIMGGGIVKTVISSAAQGRTGDCIGIGVC
jgi:U3 small nucleolar RNA-associated protein 6